MSKFKVHPFWYAVVEFNTDHKPVAFLRLTKNEFIRYSLKFDFSKGSFSVIDKFKYDF